MIEMVLGALLAAQGSAPAGCADHWRVELNADSFANNGAQRTFTATELEAFRAKAEGQIRSAIGDACRSGEVKLAAAKAIQSVEVSSASGASDPFLYSTGGRKLRFEWIFAEENLAVPPAADIVAGAACWIDPNGAACANSGD